MPGLANHLICNMKGDRGGNEMKWELQAWPIPASASRSVLFQSLISIPQRSPSSPLPTTGSQSGTLSFGR